jgi:hypothetical protein
VQIQHIGQDKCGIDSHVDPKSFFVHFKDRSHFLLNSDGSNSCSIPIDGVLRSQGVPFALVENQGKIQDKADWGKQLGCFQKRAHGRVCGEVLVNE